MTAIVALAGFLLGFGKAGVAGSFGPIVTVLLVLSMPADDALGVLLPMLIFADVFSVAAHWRRWETRLVVPLVGSAFVGIAAGTVVLATFNETWLRKLIGLALMAFVGMLLLTRGDRPRMRRPGVWAIGAGSAAGFTSSVAHSGGPPMVVYLMAAGLEPRRLVATTVACFALINLIKVPGYAVAGIFDAGLIRDTVAGWIFIPVGVWAGRMLVSRINRAVFERVMLTLIAIGSLVLLVG